MEIYTIGLHTQIISDLKSHRLQVSVLYQLPDPELIRDQCLIVTSDQVPVTSLESLRERYPDAVIFYMHLHTSVRGYQHLQCLCNVYNIHFLSPRATSSTIIDKLNIISGQTVTKKNNIIGVFGSGTGVGVTTIGHTLARQMSNYDKKVLFLGLNLFNPGYDYLPNISLDQLRSKIKGRLLKPSDFDSFLKMDKYLYMPGNYDFVGASDYQEDEIEYLLQQASEFADIVIADFGAIPESAAYYVGLQQSGIRLFVSHQSHQYVIRQIMLSLSHLDLSSSDFIMIVNRGEETSSSKRFAEEQGMLFGHSFTHYQNFKGYGLPLGKKELQQLEKFVKGLMISV